MAGDESLDPEASAILAQRAKAMLRKRARNLRGSVPRSAVIKRSAAICERLAGLIPGTPGLRIALFRAIESRNEVDLAQLDVLLRARQAEVFYPGCEEHTLKFRDPGSLQAMLPGAFGILEPAPTLPEATALDWLIVPALLADPRGHRLGYGAGFYDRALPRFCPPGRAVVVVFDFQLAAELPAEPWDVACDTLVTDMRVLEAERD